MSHRHLSKAETAEVLNHHAAVHHFITASELRQPTGCLFVPTLAISNQDTSSKCCYILVTPQSVSNDLQKTLFLIRNWLERDEYTVPGISEPVLVKLSISDVHCCWLAMANFSGATPEQRNLAPLCGVHWPHWASLSQHFLPSRNHRKLLYPEQLYFLLIYPHSDASEMVFKSWLKAKIASWNTRELARHGVLFSTTNWRIVMCWVV